MTLGKTFDAHIGNKPTFCSRENLVWNLFWIDRFQLLLFLAVKEFS